MPDDAPFRPERRYVDTGKPCEHCGKGWALFVCPCGAHACLRCAVPGCALGPGQLAVVPALRLVKASDVTEP